MQKSFKTKLKRYNFLKKQIQNGTKIPNFHVYYELNQIYGIFRVVFDVQENAVKVLENKVQEGRVMVKKAKRWIAGALTVLMVGGLLPHYVLNAEEPAAETEEITEEAVVEETAVEETVIEETVEEEPAVVEETAEETVVEETVEEEAEEGIVGETVEEPVAEVPAEETVTEEPAQPVEETVVEEETVEEAETVEGANATSAVVRGYKWWYGTYFSADLRDYSVEVSGSTSAFGNAHFMRVQLIEDDGLAAAVNSEYQELTDYTAFSVEFLDKKGRPVQLKGKVDVDVTANVNGTEYAWYLNDNGSWRKASDSLRISGAVSIAKVALNGIVKLEDKEVGGMSVSIDAAPGVFPAGTTAAMEDAKEDVEVIAAVDALEGDYEIVDAVDITFDHDGEEVQPADGKTVAVKIAASADLEEGTEYKVVHIGANGAEELDAEAAKVVFDYENNKVTFEANSFSVYAIVGQARTITAHYGFMEGGVFVPFASRNISSTSTSYPANGINQNQYSDNNPNTYLIYDFPGYVYKETRLSTETGTIIWPVLRRADTGYYWTSYNWQYTSTSADDVDDPSWTTFTNNNNNVYIIYEPKTITQGASGDEGGEGGGGESENPDLPAGKSVEPNGDGTYDVTLSVTGKVDTTVEITRASVIVIFDTSNSMNYNMAGQSTTQAAQRRINIAKTAVNELAETLLGITDEQTGEHLVQMALITFDDTAQVKSIGGKTYTTTYSEYESAVNGIQLAENGDGATNWEAALLKANALEVSQNAPTYVIFVSDGDPTFRNSRMNDTDNTVHNTTQVSGYNRYLRYIKQGLFGTGRAYLDAHYNAAVRVAQEIVDANKEFYTVGLSSQGARMSNLAAAVTDADHYFPGNDPDELAAAFSEIAKAVRENIGFTDVSVDDGVTELTTVEADSLTGTPVNFVYRKGTNSDDPTQNAVWSGAPEATITNDNHVIWDVASIGTLENGVTYSVTFTVWPSQESYDIIADINNGIIRDSSGAIIRIGTPAEAYAAQPEDVRKQIGIVSGVYTLLTNTGANVSYKYNGISDGNEVTVKKEGAMPLATSYFGIEKEWLNQLPQDSRTAQVLTKQDEDGKYYLINGNDEWILDDGGNKIEYDRSNPSSWQDKAVYYIDLIVTKGGEDYTEVRLTSESGEGKTAWAFDQMFIAPGVITHDTTATSGTITVRETGHEYTVREKPSDAYYWELTAETYHPMVINGVATVLQEVTENAPEMDDNTFNGNYYKFDGKVYEVLGSADDALITAVNHRRSYLNLTKEVSEDSAPGDALFEYKITIIDPNGEDLWFSAYDPVSQSTVMDLEVTGATAEAGGTGYWYVASGQEFTIKIKAGWNVRFTNLMSTTTYVIEEVTASMDEGFVFEKVEATAEINGQAQTYEPEIDEAVISGDIGRPNTDYTVTYTNDYLGYFYVYHSSNNIVERLPMAVNGVKVTSFNIFERTAEGTFYGGYYSDYAGKSSGFDAAALTYTDGKSEDEDGKAYTYAYIKESNREVWNYSDAYGVSGSAMAPEKDGVYYLKEVPTAYLLPYTHYTYNKSDKLLRNMWYLSAIDDLCYDKAGFFVETVNANGEKEATVVDTLTVTNATGGATVVLSPNSVFGNKGGAGNGVQAGYLTYWDAKEKISAGAVSEFTPFWLTKDGFYVCGLSTRTIRFNNGKVGSGGMRISDDENKVIYPTIE